MFNFSCLAAYVASHYNKLAGACFSLGTLTLTAGSQHLYHINAEGARACLLNPYKAQVGAHEVLGVPDEPEKFIDHLWHLASTPDGQWASGSMSDPDLSPFTSPWLVHTFEEFYGKSTDRA